MTKHKENQMYRCLDTTVINVPKLFNFRIEFSFLKIDTSRICQSAHETIDFTVYCTFA
jgi:hypothetical protein